MVVLVFSLGFGFGFIAALGLVLISLKTGGT